MGSEYRRDREKRTLEISQTQFIRNVVDRFGITTTSTIPASPSLGLRYVNHEKPAVDAIFREIVWGVHVECEPDETRHLQRSASDRAVLALS